MRIYKAEDLDSFVAETDRLGGVGSPEGKALWANFSYQPTVAIDQTLDPYSPEYFAQQIALYKELSGREMDAVANEMTSIDVEQHVGAPNPYGVFDPSTFVVHYLRLGTAIRRAGLPLLPKLLDMGAGWGLSSEFFATLGCNVTAVDINPSFVDLIRRRQTIHGNKVKALAGAFDDFEPPEAYDAVFFYECLHHAAKPWELLARAVQWLAPGGKIIFAGEPVNEFWWRHWGMRLDAQSIYCIRKFGWFESGWSRSFIVDCLRRAGTTVDYYDDPDPEVGSVCVATKVSVNQFLPAAQLHRAFEMTGWKLDGEYLTAFGEASLVISRQPDAAFVHLDIWNFRPKQLHLVVIDDDGEGHVEALPTGKSIIRCKLDRAVTNLHFVADTWVPADETGNGDVRSLSFHIGGATLV